MDGEVEEIDESSLSVTNLQQMKTYTRRPNKSSGLSAKLEILQDFGEITEEDITNAEEEIRRNDINFSDNEGGKGILAEDYILPIILPSEITVVPEVPSPPLTPVRRSRGRPKKNRLASAPTPTPPTAPSNSRNAFPCKLCGNTFNTAFGCKIHESACRRHKMEAEEAADEDVAETDDASPVIEEVIPLKKSGEVLVKRRRGRPPKSEVPEPVPEPEPLNKSPEKSKPVTQRQFKCGICTRAFKSLTGRRIHQSACRRHNSGKETNAIDDVSKSAEVTPVNTPDLVGVKRRRGRPPKVEIVEPPSPVVETHYQCELCSRIFNTLPGCHRHETICRRNNMPEGVDPDGYQPNLPIYSKQLNILNQTLDGSLTGEQIPIEAVDVKDPYIFEEGRCHCCGEDIETAHMGGEFECGDCKKLFRLKSSLERHRRVVHNEGETFQCPECDARCPDKGTLARHMYTHTGLKPVSCPVCKTEFSRKYHLIRHNYQTGCDGSRRPTFPCQVCGRIFNRKDNLREHLRAHAGQTKRKKKYTCLECNKEFLGMALLSIHKRTHNPNLLEGDKPYGCDFCTKRFPSNGALKKHRRKHTGERPYECTYCFARFAAKETLNRHLRTHTGVKPHTCQYCGKGFIQASQLRAHVFHHSGEGGFTCDLCGKSFNRRQRLQLHIKYVHEGAEPYKCEHCIRTFLRKEDLARHQLLHSGVKDHKCPICEKCFAMKSSLKIHLLTHTKEPPRSCDECGRAFIRQDCLLRHMRTKHRDMLEEIMAEAEKKKLQQQLLAAANQAALELPSEEPHVLTESSLADSIRELLTLLVDETTLKAFGWPDSAVDKLLEAVIRRCGHQPAGFAEMAYADRLRENAKLLFTVVIDDTAVKTLLNNQTVDEVILHVLRLAKS